MGIMECVRNSLQKCRLERIPYNLIPRCKVCNMAAPLRAVLVIWCFLVSLVHADFNPNVSISACNSKKVVIKLRDAAEGGIIYIKGRGPECKQTTESQPKEHEFGFDLCNLEFDTTFRVVIQKNPIVQTGHDKVIPVTCFVDMGAIVVGNYVYPTDPDAEDAVNKTTKPTARMRILSNSSDDITGGMADLNNKISVQLELEDSFRQDFDIKAKECVASTIKVIKDDCSVDRELFPDFVRNDKGDLSSEFDVFVPTNLAGYQRVDVSYACTLVVCRGSCSRTVCGQLVGWGRKRRDADDDDEYDRIVVGSSITVITPSGDQEPLRQEDEMCVDKIIGVAVGTVSAMLLVFSWILSAYLYKRMREGKGQPGINVAQRVGRRLSAMLNIPTNYELRDQKILRMIPEDEGTPPKRRKSISVSSVSIATQTLDPEPEINQTFRPNDGKFNQNDTRSSEKITEEKKLYNSNDYLDESDNDDSINIDVSNDEESNVMQHDSDNNENQSCINDNIDSDENELTTNETSNRGKWKPLLRQKRFIMDKKMEDVYCESELAAVEENPHVTTINIGPANDPEVINL